MNTASEILFQRTGFKRTNITHLAEAMNRHRCTLQQWRKNPDVITYGDLKKLVTLQELTNKQILALFGRSL